MRYSSLPLVLVLALCAWALVGGPSPAGARPAPRDAAKSGQDRARSLFQKGRTLFNLGRHAEALEQFTRAYEASPLSGLLYNIAQCHRFLGNWERAAYFYRGYLRDNPGVPNTHIVEDLIRRCQAKLAKEKQSRERAQGAFEEGRKAFRLADFRAALEHYRRAYGLQPLAGYLYHIAEAHRQLGEYQKAITLYQGYLKDNPGAPMEQVQAHIRLCQEKLEARRRALKPKLGDPGSSDPLKGALHKPVPVHRRWWLWTSVAAAVVAVAVGLGVGLGAVDHNSDPPLPQTPLGLVDWR